MSKSNRPLSPHLQVYRPQMTSVMSILHRATGAALAVGSILFVYWLWSVAGGEQRYNRVASFFDFWLIKFALFCWTLAFYYHLLNGIRHLMWDFGAGFELKEAYLTGKIVIGATIVLTLFTWLVV